MTEFKNYEIADICPDCGIPLHLSTQLSPGDQTPPTVGDISICFNCACVLIFRENLSQEKISEKELSEIDEEDRREIEKFIKAVKAMPKFKKRFKEVKVH